MKYGRREKKYSLKNIADFLKIERKTLYNLSKKDFYKVEALIISEILKRENKEDLKILYNLKNCEEPNFLLENYKSESKEIQEALIFIKETKMTSQELIDYFYLKEKLADMIKITENSFCEDLQKRKDIFKDKSSLFLNFEKTLK